MCAGSWDGKPGPVPAVLLRQLASAARSTGFMKAPLASTCSQRRSVTFAPLHMVAIAMVLCGSESCAANAWYCLRVKIRGLLLLRALALATGSGFAAASVAFW